MDNLISGLIGALIATVLSVVYEVLAQRLRMRAEVAIATVVWLDSIYSKLQDIRDQKQGAYTGGKLVLDQPDYNRTSKAVWTQIQAGEMGARFSLVFGDSEEVSLFSEIRAELLWVARALWNARSETWEEASTQINDRFKGTIDPLRTRFERQLLESASTQIMLGKLKSFPKHLFHRIKREKKDENAQVQ